MERKKNDAENAKKATLETLTQVDDNIWTLVYKGSYGLDEMLEKGIAGMGGIIRFAQKYIHSKQVLLNPFAGKFGCSSFNTRTPENDVIFGRNFDYKDSLCFVVWTAPENGYKSMTVTLGTFLLYGKKWQNPKNMKYPLRVMGAPYCCMDGVNEKGLAAAILEIKTKPTKQKTGKKPITTPVALRAVLDKCKNVEEAIEMMSRFDMRDLIFANYHYHFADADGNSAIIEYVNHEMKVIRQKYDGENLKLTNYFLSEGGDNRKEMGRDRYQKIDNKLCECDHKITEEDAMKLLESCTLYYHHKWMPHMVITVWSSVYNCTQRTMTMCAGMDYSKRYQFSLNEPGKITKLK